AGPDLIVIARTIESPIAAFRHRSLPVYGIQFHPEVSHTEFGADILRAFAEICGLSASRRPWSAAEYADRSIAQVRDIVGDDRVLLALSGGVDSSTLCALLSRALMPGQLVAVYVDSGLMDAASERVTIGLCATLGVCHVRWDAAVRFFAG